MKLKKYMATSLAVVMGASALVSGCGINGSKVVATVNGKDITLGYANFVARYDQASYDSFFTYYYGEDYWTNSDYANEDGTMEDSVKSEIMDEIEMTYLLEEHLEEYGVEITDEEKAAMTASAEQFMTDNSKSAIREMGATQEYVEEYLYRETVFYKMKEAIMNTADQEVSDDEAAQKTFSYIRISKSKTDDSGNAIEMTEDDLAALKEEAEAALEEAKEDFDSVKDNHEDYTSSKHSYSVNEDMREDDSSFDETVMEEAEKLKEGEISGLIETDEYYFIIRMDSLHDDEATESKKDNIISDRKNEKYTEVTDSYKESAEITLDEKAWAKVKFDNIFDRITLDDDTSADAE